MSILEIETSNENYGIFITASSAGEPFRGRSKRRATATDSSFVRDMWELTTKKALKSTLGRRWHKSYRDTQWIIQTENRDRRGKNTVQLHTHGLIYGPKVPMLLVRGFPEILQEEYSLVHKKHTLLFPPDIHMVAVGPTEVWRIFDYMQKNVQNSPSSRSLERAF